jgi:hypothetical protein
MAQVASRTQEFTAGSGAPTETPSLKAGAAKFMSGLQGYKAMGTNMPYTLDPGNGNSSTDAARQLPGLTGNNVRQLPAANGVSSQTLRELQPTYATPV